MKNRQKTIANQIELRINAYPQYLSVARLASRRVAELAQMNDEDIDNITLAIEEALANVIKHSYGGPCDKPIIIKISQFAHKGDKPTGLEITIRDFGKKVDPESIEGRDLDEVRPGGLGVHIIRSVMDLIEYISMDDEGMMLRMVKYDTSSKNIVNQ